MYVKHCKLTHYHQLRLMEHFVAENKLKQNFCIDVPNTVWVTDITYIKTHEGWLYLAVVIDLYSRRVVGWSMQSRMQMDLVLIALPMEVVLTRELNGEKSDAERGTVCRKEIFPE